MTMNFKPYVTRDPAICGGEPVVTGTRVTVRTILASHAHTGMNIKLDENLPARLAGVLSAHGHDVHTVPGKKCCAISIRNCRRALSRIWTEIKVR